MVLLAPEPDVCKSRCMGWVGGWVGTVAFSIAFGATLLFFDVLLRLATPLGRGALERVGVLLQRALVWTYRLAGIRPELEISSEFRPGTTYLIVSNHQSMFDTPLFAWAMPDNRPKYISKKSLARGIPGISYNLRHGGHALIDRSDRDSSVQAIRTLARAAEEDGSSVVIFPEGTRRRDGTLAPFKPAGSLALFAEAPHAPIVPVCIHNSWRILENDFKPVPFGIHLRMWVGAPIERHPDEDRLALLRRAEAAVAETLERFRREEE